MKHLALATTYSIDEDYDDEKFIKMRAKIMHSGVNPNQSNFDRSVIDMAEKSIYNTPILAHVVFDEFDNPDFSGHDMHIEVDKNNSEKNRLIYDEQPIGIVPETCNYSVENINGLDYVFVDIYIFKEYINYARDIIERDKEIKLSMEIYVDKFKSNNKLSVTDILEYRYKGITFLGKDKGTGMKDAKAITYEFSEEAKEKFIKLVDELKFSIGNNEQSAPLGVDINNNENNKFSKQQGNGGIILKKKIEILTQHNLKAESLDFNIEELSLAEFEIKIDEFIKAKKILDDNKFSLNVMEKLKEIRILLSEVKYEDAYWNELVSRYWLMDVQDNEVICMDAKDNYRIYGIAMIENGDSFTLDFAGCKRKKTTYEDFVGATEDNVITKLFVDDIIQASICIAEKRIENINKEFDAYKEDHSVKNEDVEILKQFQASKLSEEHKANVDMALSEFEDLNENEEFIDLKNNALSYEKMEDLKKECYAIRGKSVNIKFSKTPEDKNIKIPVDNNLEKEDIYGGLFSIYK